MPYGPNVIPTMTGDTTPSGVASAEIYYGSDYPWKAFDGNDATYWQADPHIITWLAYEAIVTLTIKKYAWRGYSGADVYNPKDWTFEGSNDGVTWDVIDTQTGYVSGAGTLEEFETPGNIGSYARHRINITATQNNAPPIIATFEMYEDGVPVDPPTVTSVSPNAGDTAGGTAVTITGTGFASVSGVTFGGVAATSVVTASATSVTCTTPAHAAGPVTVVVTNGDAQTGTLASAYAYAVPPSGSGQPRIVGVGVGMGLGL